jgi:hypothetical protein
LLKAFAKLIIPPCLQTMRQYFLPMHKGLKYVSFIITLTSLDAPIPPPHKPSFINPIVEYISIHHTFE